MKIEERGESKMNLKQIISDKIVNGEYEGHFKLRGYNIYYKYNDVNVSGYVKVGKLTREIKWDLHSNRFRLI